MIKFLVRIYLSIAGKKVGEDEYGNQFFELRRKDYLGRKKRYCLYKGTVEASKISPEWHPFMHYQISADQVQNTYKKYKWQKPFVPDTTLSKERYLPRGHLLFKEEESLYSLKSVKSPFKTKIWKPN